MIAAAAMFDLKRDLPYSQYYSPAQGGKVNKGAVVKGHMDIVPREMQKESWHFLGL